MSDAPTDANEIPPHTAGNNPMPAREPFPARQPIKSSPEVSPVLRNWQVLDLNSDSTPMNTRSAVPTAHATRYVDVEIFDPTGIEIEGEATVVESPPGSPAGSTTGSTSDAQRTAPYRAESLEDVAVDLAVDDIARTITDQQDPAIVVTLAERHQQVLPGEETVYTLKILNNGTERADFRVTVEGWIDEEWLKTPVPQLGLNPGEEWTVPITLAPPRRSTSLAGEYALAFIVREYGVRAAEYGQRMTRLGARLTILPYTDLRLGRIQPTATQLSWWQKETMITVPIVNRSNHAMQVALHVRQSPQLCECRVAMPRLQENHTHNNKRASSETGGDRRRTQATTVIAAGQTAKPAIHVRLHNHPLVALRPLHTALQIVTTTVAHGELPQQPWARTTGVAVTATPLFGIWHLTSLIGMVVLAVMAAGMAGVAALLIFSLGARQPEPAQVVAQPVVAPPLIIAYIQAPVNSLPAPPTVADVPAESPAESPIDSVVAPIISMGDVTDPGNATNSVTDETLPGSDPATFATTENASPPIVSQAQVSAPGAVATAAPANPPAVSASGALPAVSASGALPAVSASGALPAVNASGIPPATPAPMTYATMFREIAGRYELNWRILAAQAYVESGFDTVALGQQGDLGLMQVLPSTWHEWAPTVAATDPFDSYSNVLVAAAYLDYLHNTLSKQGHPEMEWTLVAYNWGIDKVLQHLKAGREWDDLESVRREYAAEVLRLAETIPADG